MKSYLTVIGIMLMAFSARAEGIGVVDVSRVISDYALTKDIQADLNKRSAASTTLADEKARLDVRENVLKNVQKDSKYWVDMQNLRLDQTNFERSVAALEADVAAAKERGWKIISDKVNAAVTKIATDAKLSAVFRSDAPVYFDKNVDITQKVIDALNAEYKTALPPAPAPAPAATVPTPAK